MSPGQAFSATRNPHYWQNGRPYLDKVVVTNIPEQASKLQALLANQVDLIDNIDFSLAGTVKASPGHQTISLKDAVWWAVSMDPRKNPVFKDARVVKAIKLAVNRTELLNSVFAGFGSIAYDNVIPGSDPYFANLPQPPHDVAAAKSLLREAGSANGLNLELTVAPLEGSIVNFAVAIKVKQVPSGTFWDQVWLHNPMYIPSWNRRHPDEILSLAFVSSGPWNETAFANPAVDAAVKAARSTIDLGKQKEAYAVCQKILSEQDSHLLPVYRDRIWGATNKLHDVQLNFVTFSDYTNSWMG
ncbi:MAG: hypothetical protein E6H04_13950 [Bacillati bacterium ANGP1]|uniref:Solute-binding protein family 5 domain-containing protein n=1 Tax=Candidatus Segetimicrobium genomatis TaxID=2569760 RepID=A0A537J1Y6_9BACT|nr:MAG: hypothetical protein E6H04_13950 [Terrabacteria group bacterium ANGP1]